jgi:hypothetical protein
VLCALGHHGDNDVMGSGRTMSLRAGGWHRSMASRAQERHGIREDDGVVGSGKASWAWGGHLHGR